MAHTRTRIQVHGSRSDRFAKVAPPRGRSRQFATGWQHPLWGRCSSLRDAVTLRPACSQLRWHLACNLNDVLRGF
jgi:hypothetical protein